MSECQPSLVGIWRVSEDGFTYDQAYKEMRRYYFGPQFKQLSGAVKARQTPSWNCISDGLYLVYGVTGEANSPANWNSVFAELVIDTEIDLTLEQALPWSRFSTNRSRFQTMNTNHIPCRKKDCHTVSRSKKNEPNQRASREHDSDKPPNCRQV